MTKTIFIPNHKKWLCRRPDYEDNWNCVNLGGNSDSKDAAEQYCEDCFFEWDYPEFIEIEVKESDNAEIEVYVVDVIPVPSFEARCKDE